MTAVAKSSGFAYKFASNDGECALVVEDDGRVAYAYLLNAEGQIRGDVWLYNRCPTPTEPEWFDREKAPFANPVPFASPDVDFSMPSSVRDLSVQWEGDRGACVAKLFIHGRLTAVLMEGVKPGWSVMAEKDGPLAKVLVQ